MLSRSDATVWSLQRFHDVMPFDRRCRHACAGRNADGVAHETSSVMGWGLPSARTTQIKTSVSPPLQQSRSPLRHQSETTVMHMPR